MTLAATQFNAPGQLHNDVYRYPKEELTLLYYPNGTPTGNALVRSKLLYPEGLFQAQLDYKEIVTWGGIRYVFQRGGYVPDGDPVPYGHVRLADIYDNLGSPVPAGGGRGAAAPLLGITATLNVHSIPLEMGYKTASGSRWDNYGNPGIKYNADGAYTYMTWSTVRNEAGTGLGSTVAGGGLVRALVPNGGHVDLCDVKRIHAASLASNGTRNGTVTLAYCHRSHQYGWLVASHQYKDNPEIHHLVR